MAAHRGQHVGAAGMRAVVPYPATGPPPEKGVARHRASFQRNVTPAVLHLCHALLPRASFFGSWAGAGARRTRFQPTAE
eukprot:333801-Chlamydomonas_euryale.AAC.4